MDDAEAAARIAGQLGLRDFKEAIVSRSIQLCKAWRDAKGKGMAPLELLLAATTVATRYTMFPADFTCLAVLDAATACGVAKGQEMPAPDVLQGRIELLRGAICKEHEAYPLFRDGEAGQVCARCFALLPPARDGSPVQVPVKVLAMATAAVQALVEKDVAVIDAAVADAKRTYQGAGIALGDKAAASVIAGLATAALDSMRLGDLARRLGVPRATLKDAMSHVTRRPEPKPAEPKPKPLPQPQPKPQPQPAAPAPPVEPHGPPRNIKATTAPSEGGDGPHDRLRALFSEFIEKVPQLAAVSGKALERCRSLVDPGLAWNDQKQAAGARRVAKAVLVQAAHAAFLPLDPRELFGSWADFVRAWEAAPPVPTRSIHPHLVKAATALVEQLGGDVSAETRKHLQDTATLCKPWIAGCYPTAQVPVLAGIELARQGVAHHCATLARAAYLPKGTFKGMLERVAAEAPVPRLDGEAVARYVQARASSYKDVQVAAMTREIARVARRVPATAPVIADAEAMAREWIERRPSGRDPISTNACLAAMWVYRACVTRGIAAPAKQLGIEPNKYAAFCKAVGLPVSPAPPPAITAEDVSPVVEACTGKVGDRDLKDSIGRFLAVASKHLMGFTFSMAVAVVALVFATRVDGAVQLTQVAKAAGVRVASLHNSANRFLRKVGRPGDSKAPIIERVRAAFPPRALVEGKKEETGC